MSVGKGKGGDRMRDYSCSKYLLRYELKIKLIIGNEVQLAKI